MKRLNDLLGIDMTRALSWALLFVGASIALWGGYLAYSQGSPFYIVIGTGFVICGQALRLK